jgi:uroporphyrin-3 C-methyltransferase
LLLALLSLAGAGYLWWSGRDSGAAVAENEAAIAGVSADLEQTRASLESLEGRIGELDETGGEQADRLASLEEQFEEFQQRHDSVPGRLSSLENSVSSLQGISAGTRDSWLVAEAEHYLQIANAQLQLAGNPERALLALRFADQRIRQLRDPALTDVRRALSRDLRALDAMEQPDIAGVSMTLTSLAETVDSLPLKEDVARPESEAAEVPVDASGFDRALASVKSAFSGIVSVRRTDEEVTPLMSPDAAYFLRTNLALKLQAARLALLRGEQEIFEQSLADAADWLREYYAADSRAVRTALEDLEEMRQADYSVTPPDISASLRLLRQYQERRTADAPDAPADEPAQ